MSKASRRFYRTIMLGVAALGMVIWAAFEQFGISPQEILELFAGTLWIAAGMIGLAGLCALLWIVLRKVLTKDGNK